MADVAPTPKAISEDIDMNYASTLPRFRVTATGEEGYVMQILNYWPVISETTPVGGPNLFTPVNPFPGGVYAVVVYDGTGTTDTIPLDSFTYLFK